MKLFVNRDLSWQAFACALGLSFIVVNAFRGDLPGGAFSERAPVLMLYLGNFLASFIFAALMIVVVWGVHRVIKKPYETPRRDLALATLIMLLITFKSANAQTPAEPPARPAGAATEAAQDAWSRSRDRDAMRMHGTHFTPTRAVGQLAPTAGQRAMNGVASHEPVPASQPVSR